MKTLLMVVVLFLAGVMVGCTSVETSREHFQRMWLEEELHARNMVEDWDFFWLADRNSRLTGWHARMGF